ncbi:MAG: tetratricopeptide repeat protein, partial [Bacteroidetes bacterium]|nr:tetratricopeptide repeat protein [Bacteroidota bacterium]
MKKKDAKTLKKQAPLKTNKSIKPESDKRKNRIYLFAVLIITAIVYATSLQNGWIKNWDDGKYIFEQEIIHKLSFKNIAGIFNLSYFWAGNYHPLTTAFYAVEYSLVGYSPFLYHFNNFVFHLLNVFLVFAFIRLLTKKTEIAAFVALMFGIHPMHVESVAWISERKDVLYSFFFLLSMLLYLKTFNEKSNVKRLYVLSLLMFFLSCLAKSAATSLPIVLILIDYYKEKQWKWGGANNKSFSNNIQNQLKWLTNSVVHKAPFFLIALLCGIEAVRSQSSSNAIQNLTPLYTAFERILIPCYSTVLYLFKLIIPINLCAMYPYPDKITGHLPSVYYFALAIIPILITILIISRKNKDIIFGILFFFATIILVLQIVPVGGAIAAERYTYIPYIGLFFIIGKGIVFLLENTSKFNKNLTKLAVFALISVFSILTFQRIRIWEDGKKLFTNVIQNFPNMPMAYDNRGFFNYTFGEEYYKQKGFANPKQTAYDSAIADFTKCLSVDSTYFQAYANRGMLFYNRENHDYYQAVRDFTKALKYKNNDLESLVNRGNCYSSILKYDLALIDYDKYIELKKDNAKAYLWRGIALYNLGKFNEAHADMSKCIELDNSVEKAYMWRGILNSKNKDYQAAIKDLDKSLQLDPNSSEPYIWRGIAKYNQKMYKEA